MCTVCLQLHCPDYITLLNRLRCTYFVLLSTDNNIDSNWGINLDKWWCSTCTFAHVPRDWLNDWIRKERDWRFTHHSWMKRVPWSWEIFHLQNFTSTLLYSLLHCMWCVFGLFLKSKAQHIFINLSTFKDKYFFPFAYHRLYNFPSIYLFMLKTNKCPTIMSFINF